MSAEKMRRIIAVLRARFSGNRYSLHTGKEKYAPAELLPLAKKHGVDWLVGSELLDLPASQTQNCAKSRDWLRSASVDALHNCADLLRIEALCSKQNIAVIFFKGAALAASIYGNVAGRRYGDIDLLVSSYADASRVRQMLLQAGYEDKERLGIGFAELKSRYHIEFQLVSPAGTGVDIHWKLFHDYYLRYPVMHDEKKITGRDEQTGQGRADNRFQAAAVNGGLKEAGDISGDLSDREKFASVNICGRQVTTLSPEDNLLVLCAHHTTHCWNELRLVCDIAGVVLAHGEVDYIKLFARAREMGMARMLATGLHLAQLALLVDLPYSARIELRGDRLARLLAQRLWQRLQTGRYEVEKAEIMLLEIAARDNWPQRCHFVLGAVTAPSDNDFRFISLSPEWQWLYYFFRPLRQLMQTLAGTTKVF